MFGIDATNGCDCSNENKKVRGVKFVGSRTGVVNGHNEARVLAAVPLSGENKKRSVCEVLLVDVVNGGPSIEWLIFKESEREGVRLMGLDSGSFSGLDFKSD